MATPDEDMEDLPRSLGAAANPKSVRLRHLERMHDEQISDLLQDIRATNTIGALEYHFHSHGHEFGATTEAEYRQALVQHLQSDVLRIFTHLQGDADERYWRLTDPKTRAVAVYNEDRREMWSFYRAAALESDMINLQPRAIDVLETGLGIELRSDWTW